MAVTDAAERGAGNRTVLRDTILALMGTTRTTQTALAEYLGIPQSSLSKRLNRNGSVPFSEDHLDSIAWFFHLTSPADLYDPERALTLCRERFPRGTESRCITVCPGQGHLFTLAPLTAVAA